MSDGCLVIDADWRITYVNVRALEIYRPMSLTRASLVGESVWAQFPGLEGTAIDHAFRSAMTEQATQRSEFYYPPLGGWFLVRVIPSPEGITVLFEDITRRKQAEAALEAEKQLLARIVAGDRLESLLETIAREVETRSTAGMLCSILLLEPETNRLRHGAAPSLPADYNAAIDGLLIGPGVGSCGTAAAERRIVCVVDVSTHPYWDAFKELAQRSGLAACTSTPMLGSEGAVLGTIAMYYREPRAPDEGDRRLIEVARDIAVIAVQRHHATLRAEEAARERERLLDAERHARGEAEHASRMKDEFLSTLSHELRTPLAAVTGWTQLLRAREPRPDQLAKGLEVIERNARVQLQMIEDLLDMSRVISGKIRLDVQVLMPAPIVEAAITTIAPAAAAKDLRIESVLDPNAGPIAGDPGRLQQVLWNLLTNAVKFTPKGGKLQVVLARVNSHVEICVSDSGIGIDPAFLPHVFERFRQADGSTTRKYGGLGLGLAIVKNLVELHGGTIAVDSEGAGKGTTFHIHLPVSLAHKHTRTQERAHPKTGVEPTEVFQPLDLAGLRIIVVDDQPDARELAARLLTECGARVKMASGAREALHVIEGEVFDLLISDISMPDMDGYALIREVRALPAERGGAMRAIAMTAFARSEDRTRALRAGFQVHLAKPVDPAELVATIASVCGRTGIP